MYSTKYKLNGQEGSATFVFKNKSYAETDYHIIPVCYRNDNSGSGTKINSLIAPGNNSYVSFTVWGPPGKWIQVFYGNSSTNARSVKFKVGGNSNYEDPFSTSAMQMNVYINTQNCSRYEVGGKSGTGYANIDASVMTVNNAWSGTANRTGSGAAWIYRIAASGNKTLDCCYTTKYRIVISAKLLTQASAMTSGVITARLSKAQLKKGNFANTSDKIWEGMISCDATNGGTVTFDVTGLPKNKVLLIAKLYFILNK